MFTKVLIAVLAVVLCTGGVALAATLPEKIHTTTSTAPQTVLEATEAENIALEATGLAREQVRFDRSELDYERGVAVWEIEFRHEYTEYDFEIDAYTGEILKNKAEKDDDYVRSPVDEATPPPANEPTVSEPPIEEQKELLDAARAEEIALEAAGLAREQVRFDRSELDYERGVAVWEIEFRHEYTEYDFEIDAYTGEILKSRTEHDDDYIRSPVDEVTPPPATEPAAELTKEQALAIALDHAGLTEEQVTYVKVEKDFDDGRWVYEIEFREGRTEYEYEVRASDGKIVDYDKDWDD